MGYRILGLDVATKTGWCTETTHGSWDLSTKKTESKNFRLIKFKARLREMCSMEQINLIAFERTAGQHKNALIVQAELHGVLLLYCEENNIDYVAFSATEIKKAATGKGNSNKAAMILAAQEKYGYAGNDDNTADAIHIYNLAKEQYN